MFGVIEWWIVAGGSYGFLLCVSCVIICLFTWTQLNSAKVVAVGPGERDRDGKLIPVSLKEGDTVLLPEYGGTEVKLAEKEYVKLI